MPWGKDVVGSFGDGSVVELRTMIHGILIADVDGTRRNKSHLLPLYM